MESDEETTERVLGHIINHIADSRKASTHLHKFAKANEQRVYKLMRAVMDPNADYKPILKNGKEIMKRIEQYMGGAAAAETMSVILRRISLTLVGKSSIPRMIERAAMGKRAANNKEGLDARLGPAAEKLIKDISTIFPAIHRSHIEQFTELLNEENPALATESLEALARFVKTFPQEGPKDRETKARLMKFALEGTPEQAKYATVVLAHLDSDDGEDACAEIIERIFATLTTLEDENRLLTHLSSLAQLARYAPVGMFEQHHMTLVNFLVKEVLMKNRNVGAHGDTDWVEYEDLHVEGKLKMMAVKVLVNRLIAAQTNQEDQQPEPLSPPPSGSTDSLKKAVAEQLAPPVFKLLRKILETDGELSPEKNTPMVFQTYLRMFAGLSTLKLARFVEYKKMIEVSDFIKLTLIVQDPIYQVRNAMIEKLCKCLQNKEVPFSFITAIMLAAHEPEEELKNKAKGFIARKAKQQRQPDEPAVQNSASNTLVESMIVRFVHLLSHHPDFAKDIEDLHMFAAYIDFFLDAVGTSENVSFMYHMVAKVKTMRDRHADDSENLYILSEMVQFLIHEKCNSAGWSLPSYPADIDMPRDLFEKLPSKEASENMKKSYLPPAFVQAHQATVQKAKTPAKKGDGSARRKSTSRSATASPSPSPSPRSPSAKKRTSGAALSENDSEDEDDADELGASSKKPKRRKSSSAAATRAKTSKKKQNADEEETKPTPKRRAAKSKKPAKEAWSSDGEEAESILEEGCKPDEENNDDGDLVDDAKFRAGTKAQTRGNRKANGSKTNDLENDDGNEEEDEDEDVNVLSPRRSKRSKAAPKEKGNKGDAGGSEGKRKKAPVDTAEESSLDSSNETSSPAPKKAKISSRKKSPTVPAVQGTRSSSRLAKTGSSSSTYSKGLTYNNDENEEESEDEDEPLIRKPRMQRV
ncbi:hypothetical protein HK102_003230 [Quaeritorhiza haematococci]|nr:hypothetical protein HK102_003230 [Quaeritorhiza haematococci]